MTSLFYKTDNRLCKIWPIPRELLMVTPKYLVLGLLVSPLMYSVAAANHFTLVGYAYDLAIIGDELHLPVVFPLLMLIEVLFECCGIFIRIYSPLEQTVMSKKACC